MRERDVQLIRGVAQALNDPERAAGARALLQKQFGQRDSQSLKALLAEAPLEGIDLSRVDGPDRDVPL